MHIHFISNASGGSEARSNLMKIAVPWSSDSLAVTRAGKCDPTSTPLTMPAMKAAQLPEPEVERFSQEMDEERVIMSLPEMNRVAAMSLSEMISVEQRSQLKSTSKGI